VLLPTWSREDWYYIAERAYRLYSEGRVPEAAVLFEGLAAIDPDDAYSRKALAAISIRLGRPEFAIQHLDAVIASDRSDAEALAARCEVLIAMRELDLARRDLNALERLPAGLANVRRLEMCLRQSASQLPAGTPR
jgi:Flp pilus assembly protein TadD